MIPFKALVILSTFSLHASLEDHFKPILDKSGSHQIRNIDFIYMINLDERPEKFASSIRELAPYEITPYRFSAINGWKLTPESISDLGVEYELWMEEELAKLTPNCRYDLGIWYESWMANRLATVYLPENRGRPTNEVLGAPGRRYFYYGLGLGALGIILSHLSVLQDALDSEYETIWVMEDDVEVIQDPHILSGLIDELDQLLGKNGWDILFTDTDTKNTEGIKIPCETHAWRPNYRPANWQRFAERTDISPLFRQIGSRYGAYSMVIRRSGIKKLLSFFKCYDVFLPYDMEYTLPPGIRLFTVREDIVSTLPHAPSDNGPINHYVNLDE